MTNSLSWASPLAGKILSWIVPTLAKRVILTGGLLSRIAGVEVQPHPKRTLVLEIAKERNKGSVTS